MVCVPVGSLEAGTRLCQSQTLTKYGSAGVLTLLCVPPLHGPAVMPSCTLMVGGMREGLRLGVVAQLVGRVYFGGTEVQGGTYKYTCS